MYYRFAVLDMCDECRMTLLRNDSIMCNYTVKEQGNGSSNICEVCNRINTFTTAVLTDYSQPAKNIEKKTCFSIHDRFAILASKDQADRQA